MITRIIRFCPSIYILIEDDIIIDDEYEEEDDDGDDYDDHHDSDDDSDDDDNGDCDDDDKNTCYLSNLNLYEILSTLEIIDLHKSLHTISSSSTILLSLS